MFQLMGVDKEGLNTVDITILKALHQAEAPMGLEPLGLLTNQDERTIAEVYEPYLLRCGFIERTKQGRTITRAGEDHLAKHGHIEAPVQSVERVINRTK
jgi:Holliday junction DNA helicase RuvB